MADYEFTPVAVGPRTATSQLTLRSAAILTNGAVDSDTAAVIGYDFIVLRIAFTIGSLTSLTLKVFGYDGTSWTQTGYKATQGSGVSVITPDTLSLTATQTVALPPISCLGFQKIKVSVQGVGTVTNSLCAITATAGCYTGIRA